MSFYDPDRNRIYLRAFLLYFNYIKNTCLYNKIHIEDKIIHDPLHNL